MAPAWLSSIKLPRLPQSVGKLNNFWRTAIPTIASLLLGVIVLIALLKGGNSRGRSGGPPAVPSLDPWGDRAELILDDNFPKNTAIEATTSDRWLSVWMSFTKDSSLDGMMKVRPYQVAPPDNGTVYYAFLSMVGLGVSMTLFEFQEYQRNERKNPFIPFSLDLVATGSRSSELHLKYQPVGTNRRETVWSTALQPKSEEGEQRRISDIRIGLRLDTSQGSASDSAGNSDDKNYEEIESKSNENDNGGSLQLWWQGKAQTFPGTGDDGRNSKPTTLPIVTFRQHRDYPASGPYRAELRTTDIWPDAFGWGRQLSDIARAAGIEKNA